MDVLLGMVVMFHLLDPEVQVLVKQLGNDEWREREKASAKLKKMGERPMRILMYAEVYNTDLEIRRRAQRLVSHYMGDLIKCTKYDEIPWIECLPKDFPDRDKVLEAAFKKHGEPQYDWGYDGNGAVEYREATRSLMRAMYHKGWSSKKVRECLDKMADNEREWENQGGRSTYPPSFEK